MPPPKISAQELRVENLALSRGGRILARGIDFGLGAGQSLLVTGPNGAGKSTLLRALAGLLVPESGRSTWKGEPETSSHAHYIAHAEALKPAFTAVENLDFWSRALGGAGGLSPLAALDRFNLAHCADLPVGYLSAGQRRRVALSRLLVAPRPLWLLDEPATALDAASQARLAEVMAAHLGAGGLVIAATHAPLGLDGAAELRLGGAA